MSTPEDPTQPNDWLTPPEGSGSAAAATPAAAPGGRSSDRVRRSATAAALVAAGLVVGGGVAYAAGHHSSASPSRNGFARGPMSMGEMPDRLGGGVTGEQHIQGTVTAKTTTSVTVKTASGTTTYPVTSTTQIVRDGQTVTMSAIKVGDAVLLHVLPATAGNGKVVERLLAGTSAIETGPGGFGIPGGGPGGVPPMGGNGPQGAPPTSNPESST